MAPDLVAAQRLVAVAVALFLVGGIESWLLADMHKELKELGIIKIMETLQALEEIFILHPKKILIYALWPCIDVY